MFPELITETLTGTGPLSSQWKRDEELRQLDLQSKYCYILNPELRNREDRAKTLTLDNNLFTQLRFGSRLGEIQNLAQNWDNYGAVVPSENILKTANAFIEILPNRFREQLEVDYIFPNPNGTITMEWRNDQDVVSIEIGENSTNLYSILSGHTDTEENIYNINQEIPLKLIENLSKFVG